MQKKVQYTVTLMIVSLLASVGVSSTFLLTKDIIKKKEAATRLEALYTVLPGLEDPPPDITPPGTAEQDRVYKGLSRAGKLIGYAACGEAQGYSSKIKVMVGVDADGEKILGIDILSQNETPGLGTKMMETESTSTLWSIIFGKELESLAWDNEEAWKLPPFKQPERIKKFGVSKKARSKNHPWFQEQFKQKTYNQLIVSKIKDPEKITAITGATISTRAVIQAVKNALDKIRNSTQSQAWEIHSFEP